MIFKDTPFQFYHPQDNIYIFNLTTGQPKISIGINISVFSLDTLVLSSVMNVESLASF